MLHLKPTSDILDKRKKIKNIWTFQRWQLFAFAQDRATYTCDEDYTIVGVATVTCQASGRWSGKTQALDPPRGHPIQEHYSRN